MPNRRLRTAASLVALVLGLSRLLAEEPAAVFESKREGNYEIYLKTKSGETRLTDNPGQDRQPALSGDGKRIAFCSDRTGNMEIFVMARDGGHAVRLTDAPGEDFSPAWSAGDSQIVFVSSRAGFNDLYAMRADGRNQRPLSRGESLEYEPTWSPEMLGRNYPPRAWLVANAVSPTLVQFSLAGTWDREEGRHLGGTVDFGDGTDTAFTRVPRDLHHLYPREGTFDVVLQVQDSESLGASVFLELTLRTDFRVRDQDLEYEKGYQPKPLDR